MFCVKGPQCLNGYEGYDIDPAVWVDYEDETNLNQIDLVWTSEGLPRLKQSNVCQLTAAHSRLCRLSQEARMEKWTIQSI
ncbi:hypothetical protein BGZ88_012054, partial [Linnemannia elongata]